MAGALELTTGTEELEGWAEEGYLVDDPGRLEEAGEDVAGMLDDTGTLEEAEEEGAEDEKTEHEAGIRFKFPAEHWFPT